MSKVNTKLFFLPSKYLDPKRQREKRATIRLLTRKKLQKKNWKPPTKAELATKLICKDCNFVAHTR